jgi:hypothetical protein
MERADDGPNRGLWNFGVPDKDEAMMVLLLEWACVCPYVDASEEERGTLPSSFRVHAKFPATPVRRPLNQPLRTGTKT